MENLETRLVFKAKKRQMAFLGEIKEERWACILTSEDNLVNHTVKIILGIDFITNVRKYKVNTEIPATFVAILPTLGESKFMFIHLCIELFSKELLEDLVFVVENVDNDLMVLFADTYVEGGGQEEVSVPKRKVLAVWNEDAFEKRKTEIKRNIEFLQRWLGFKEDKGPLWWKSYLIDEGFSPELCEECLAEQAEASVGIMGATQVTGIRKEKEDGAVRGNGKKSDVFGADIGAAEVGARGKE